MHPRIPENFSTWLIDWSPATIIGHAMPPRDPNDDDEDNAMMKTTTPSRRTTSSRRW
jgi:hypothetical protein